MGALEIVVEARPDVFNHNLETVPRLYPTIRPGARYFTSLQLLAQVKQLDPSIFTKSGLMVGLGETKIEIQQMMDDYRAAVRRLPDHRAISPADAEARRHRPVRDAPGIRNLCLHGAGTRVPDGIRDAADPVQLSCRRRFPAAAGGAGGQAGPTQCVTPGAKYDSSALDLTPKSHYRTPRPNAQPY